jgi:parvulin-like peptidyl-prolyl isomerase
VRPDAQLVIEFRQLALRLRVGEIGVVESDFGFHIIKRIE